MRLETTRLILRPPTLADVPDVVAGVADIEVARMLLVVPHPYQESDARGFIERCIRRWSENPQNDFTFFLESKQDGRVIGASGLNKIDRFSGTAVTGSWIRKDLWRKGYILEAKIPILDFAFDGLELRRLETSAFAENIASQAMSEKLGFVNEGVSRAASKCRATGVIHDEVRYGLLKEEWRKARRRLTTQ